MKQAELQRDSPACEEDQLVYLYCFTRPSSPGCGGGAPHNIELAGVDVPHTVSMVELDNVAAVFGTVPREEFEGEAAASNMKDLAWVGPRALRHEAVLRELMLSFPVLPAGFGTVFSSQQALKGFLQNHSDQVSWFLKEFSDKEEWAVKGFMDAGKAVEWLVATDTALSEQRKHLPESPGVRYFQQKRLHAEAKERTKDKCRTAAAHIKEQLKELAVDVRSLRLQPKELTGRKEEMILNCACLLLRDKADDLCAAIEEMAGKYAEQGLVLEASGPWPPHSFCPRISDPEQ